MNVIVSRSWQDSGIFPQPPQKECPINVACTTVSSAFSLYANDFLEIVVISEGSGLYRTPEGDNRVQKGDAFLVPKNAVHGYSSSTGMRIDFLYLKNNIVFQAFPEILSEPAFRCFRDLPPHARRSNLFQSRLHFSEEEQKTVFEYCGLMLQENTSGGEHSTAVLWSLLHCFLIQFCRAHARQAGVKETRLYQLADILKHIENHYATPISCLELLRMYGRSRKLFNADFLEATGHNPREYILLFRLEKAKAMLKDTTLSVKEIAARCGFCDACYFCQQFRKHYRTSPKKYR